MKILRSLYGRIEQVNEAYLAIAKEHLSATHIMLGFRIFGSQFYNLQDYCDAGGRAILNVLKDMKIWNTVIYITMGPTLENAVLK